jgi:hypothetical protein
VRFVAEWLIVAQDFRIVAVDARARDRVETQVSKLQGYTRGTLTVSDVAVETTRGKARASAV